MPSFSGIQNYYERLVFDFINEELIDEYGGADDEFFQDVACYALTRLPSRYIRHEIDMAYYLAPGERSDMQEQVKESLLSAAKFIHERRQKGSGK